MDRWNVFHLVHKNPYMLKAFKVNEDKYVSDYTTMRRTLWQSLTETPWKPFVLTKKVYSPVVYFLVPDTLVCSPKTAKLLREALDV